MASGLSLTLEIAKDTLSNTQLELTTSSNNISNASTTGYAVETANQTANADVLTTSGWLGTGASVSSITESRDKYLEQKLMNATSETSQYTTLYSQLESIQAACSDSGSTGISSELGSFFDAWTTLETDSSSLSDQTSVYDSATSLASSIKSTYSSLETISEELPTQVQDVVTQANTLIEEIAGLNTAIAQTGTSTSQANELIDERYAAMDSLSALIPVSFSQDSTTGMVSVTTTTSSGSLTVVSGSTATDISSSTTVTGGELGALLTTETDLSSYMSKLNDFAATLVSEVNSTYGSTVFTATSGSEASTIAVSSTFQSGMASTSASSLTTASQAMADLQDLSVSFSDGTTSTLTEYLSNLQQTIGDDVSTASTNETFYSALKSELTTQEESVSSVSVDEELVKVIQYQQIYEAAAKVVTTAQTLMTTAIDMVK